MDEPIEDLYLNWLYSKVASIEVPPTPSLTYWTLMRDLHATEFVWLISGDDNRYEDGLEIRKEFLRAMDMDTHHPMMSLPCSVLEMMIAFSRRAAFETEICEREWFWIFLDNLGLAVLSDNMYGITHITYAALDELVWRTFEPNGSGSMFPIRNPSKDQRHIEIWAQFCEYLIDQDLF